MTHFDGVFAVHAVSFSAAPPLSFSSCCCCLINTLLPTCRLMKWNENIEAVLCGGRSFIERRPPKCPAPIAFLKTKTVNSRYNCSAERERESDTRVEGHKGRGERGVRRIHSRVLCVRIFVDFHGIFYTARKYTRVRVCEGAGGKE